MCIEIEPPNASPFIIVAWYRPPSVPISCFESLEENLRFLDRENKEIIILGDTNCDFSLPTPSNANHSSHLREIYDLFGFRQLIEEPTRITLHSSSLIDHIATSEYRNISESGVIKTSLSDHFLIYCIRKFRGGVKRQHKCITSRQLKNFDKTTFLSDLSEVNWEEIIANASDSDDAVRGWTTIFSLILDKHAPNLTRRVSDKYTPWLNSEFFQLAKTRDKLKIQAVKSKSTLLMDCYKQIRNRVNKLNLRLKRKYFSEKISECHGDLKGSWKTINQVINKSSKTTSIPSLNVEGVSIKDNKTIASSMNNFFCTIGNKLSDKIPEKPNPLLSNEYELGNAVRNFSFKAVSENDVTKVMKKMKTSHGSGCDGIASFFIKIALPLISGSLCDLFNLSLFSGKFPTDWKIARVAPIYKSGARDDCSNYRPISVLPVLSRAFEKVVYNQLYDYLDSNRLIYKHQSGFRSLHSVVTSLMAGTNDWYVNIDRGKYTGLIFIDLKKAFDTVNHDILLKKLEEYGISGLELDWFTSYLHERKQFCKVNSTSSSINAIGCGVPQGSCLGPLLFLVYINDLPFCLNKGKVTMYADDTAISHSSRCLSKLQDDLNQDLVNLQNWLHGNKLSLNVVKTQSLIIGSRPNIQKIEKQTEAKPSFEIGDQKINMITDTKYLGVQIDDKLQWDRHTEHVKAKALRALGLIKHAKKFLPSGDLQKMYRGIVEPHFSYCCSVWGCCSETKLNSLQKIQNRAARITTNSPYDASAAPLLQNLGWPSIKDLIRKETATLTYKALNSLAPQYLGELFSKCSEGSDRILRSTETNLQIPLLRTSTGQKAFSYRGAKLWNELNRETKLASSLATFKKFI